MRVPVSTSQREVTGSKPDIARMRPSALKSRLSAPAPPWSSAWRSFPVATSQMPHEVAVAADREQLGRRG